MIQLGAMLSMGVLAVCDLRTGKMPNWITWGSFLWAVALRSALAGTHGLTLSLWGALAAGAIPLGLFLATRGRAIGGGDVKALFALGAWLGPVPGLEAEMLGFIFLAIYALTRECVRGRAGALLVRSFALVVPSRLLSSAPAARPNELVELRFGPALFLGTLVVCAASWSVGM